MYKATKKISKKIKLDDVNRWLRKQQTYTLHKPIRRKFGRRKTVAAGIDCQFQAALADMPSTSTSKFNEEYRFLLCIIDVFSKYIWAVPIKDKAGKILVHAFKSVLKNGRKPKSLQTDKRCRILKQRLSIFLKFKTDSFFHY